MESPRKRARSFKDPSTPGTIRSLLPANLNSSFEDSEFSSTSRSKSTYSDISSVYTNYTQDYEAFFESVGRTNLKGNIWKLYKPVNEDSLYYEILKQPKNTKEIAINLLNNWEKDPLTVIESLVQLFVNLCGFKEFVAPDIYDIKKFKEYTEEIMVELCDDESSDIIRNHRCLFNEKFEGTRTTQILHMGVYSFLFNFIVIAFKKGILSDNNDLTTSLQIFLKVMSNQRMRQIVHTGIIISNKILSSLIMTHNLITNEYTFSPSESNTDEALSEKQNFLMLLIHNYYLNFRNIYYSKYIPYAKSLGQLKVECIRECKFWIKTHPRTFISNWEILKILNFYLHDASKHVRLAALHTLDEVLKCPGALQYITNEYMKVLIKKIVGRFDDVAVEVSTKAFRVIQTIVLCRHELISQEVVDEFSKLIFCHSAPNGIEAAKLYTTYLKVFFKSTSTCMSEDNYLLSNIVNLYRNQEEANNAKEYLIESFLRGCDELLNWDSFYDLFYKIRDDDKEIIFALSEIFAEFICQFLKGKTSVMRNRSETYPAAEQNIHQKIVNLFENFCKMIEYHETPEISSELFKVVLLVNYNCLDADNYPLMELKMMLHTAFHCFKTCQEPEMMCLSRAAEVMSQLKSLDRVKRYADPLLPDLIEETVDSAKSYLKNPMAKESILLLKLAALFKHFDLTNYFTIDELIEPFENLYDLHSIVGLANSCADYLKWELKAAESLLRTVEQNHAIYNLKSKCEFVLDALFRLFKDDHLQKPVKSEVFLIVCTLFTSFNEELIEIVTTKQKLFLMLKLSIKDDVSKNAILWYYVEYNVVLNVDMPIEERKKHLKSYVRLIEKNILSSECWANVLKLYSTHFEEFGRIVEWIFQSFIDADSKNSDDNTVLLLFLTLLNAYENILNVNGSVDFNSEKGNDLKMLSQKFASYKPLFNKREIIITKFLELLFFSNDVQKLPIIYLLEPFFKNIKDETTKNLLQEFGGFIKTYSKVDCIIWLKKLLKTK